jgi:hypothetical protein
VTSNTAIVCSGICLILFGLAECGERRTADPRKTLADHGFSAVEFHGHAPDSCWLGTGAHRFTATSGRRQRRESQSAFSVRSWSRPSRKRPMVR